MAEATGGTLCQGPAQHSNALASPHTPLTPSVKKLRSIRRLGTRFGRRLGARTRSEKCGKHSRDLSHPGPEAQGRPGLAARCAEELRAQATGWDGPAPSSPERLALVPEGVEPVVAGLGALRGDGQQVGGAAASLDAACKTPALGQRVRGAAGWGPPWGPPLWAGPGAGASERRSDIQ